MNRQWLVAVILAVVLVVGLIVGYQVLSDRKRAEEARQMEQALRDWEQSQKQQAPVQQPRP